MRDLPKIAYFTVRTTGVVALVIAAASAFAWVLTALRIPQQLTALVVSVTTEAWQFLLLVNVLLLVLGTFLEAIPIIIIMGPILYPVAQSFGIDPIHFGIIIMANTGVGFIMPPMGVCLYAAMAISGLRLSRDPRIPFPLHPGTDRVVDGDHLRSRLQLVAAATHHRQIGASA